MPSGGPGPIIMGDDSDDSGGSDHDGDDDDDDDDGGEGFPDIDIAGLLSSEDEDEDVAPLPPVVTPFSKKRKNNDEADAKKSKKSKVSRPTCLCLPILYTDANPIVSDLFPFSLHFRASRRSRTRRHWRCGCSRVNDMSILRNSSLVQCRKSESRKTWNHLRRRRDRKA